MIYATTCQPCWHGRAACPWSCYVSIGAASQRTACKGIHATSANAQNLAWLADNLTRRLQGFDGDILTASCRRQPREAQPPVTVAQLQLVALRFSAAQRGRPPSLQPTGHNAFRLQTVYPHADLGLHVGPHNTIDLPSTAPAAQCCLQLLPATAQRIPDSTHLDYARVLCVITTCRNSHLSQAESTRRVPRFIRAQPGDLPNSRERRRKVKARRSCCRLSLQHDRTCRDRA